MKRVSELITTDQIKGWENNDIITITAGTGVGKSYWVKNILYAFAKKENKKILFLIHRTNCINQFAVEIIKDKKTDIIDIRTYQSLESLSTRHKRLFDFSEYKYIVCDEFHYFLGDASFNKTTDISLNMILSQTDKVKIFMSATGDDTKLYINNIKKLPTIDYKLPITYDFIETLSFFNKDKTLEQFIKEILTGKNKAIFFIQSAKKAYELHKRFKKYTLFNCSKSNSNYYKYVDVDKIENMLKNERFEEQILITTTCLDAGVNIIDPDLKHIIVDVRDIGSLIQSIGRKRIKFNDDKVNVYIKNINNKQLGGMKAQLKRKLAMAEYFKQYGEEAYIIEYPRQYDKYCIVYDEVINEANKGTKRLNELMYYKCNIDIFDIQTMINKGKNGYCKYIKEILDYNKRYIIVE